MKFRLRIYNVNNREKVFEEDFGIKGLDYLRRDNPNLTMDDLCVRKSPEFFDITVPEEIARRSNRFLENSLVYIMINQSIFRPFTIPRLSCVTIDSKEIVFFEISQNFLTLWAEKGYPLFTDWK